MAITTIDGFAINANVPVDSRQTAADITARDAIPSIFRYEGLTVYVESAQTSYQLQGGITNGDWVDIHAAPPASVFQLSGYYNNNITPTIGGNSIGTYNYFAAVLSGYNNNINPSYEYYNLIVGGYGNTISASAIGSNVIVGGSANTANGGYSSIIGGQLNIVGNGAFNVIAGGQSNTINNGVGLSFIGGGSSNIAAHSESFIFGSNITTTRANTTWVQGLNIGSVPAGTVAYILGVTATGQVIQGASPNVGAFTHAASGRIAPTNIYLNSVAADYSSVLGGKNNDIAANQVYSVIAGGQNNIVTVGTYSFIGSGKGNQLNPTVGLHNYNVIVGGYGNTMTGNANIAFIGCGTYNDVNSYGGVIGGGYSNEIGALGTRSFIGSGNDNYINGLHSAIAGGQSNTINTGVVYAAITGGISNTLTTSPRSFIGAGQGNFITGSTGGVIGGGQANNITGTSSYSFIGGGGACSIYNSTQGVISGGNTNSISGLNYSFIGGGGNNSILGGGLYQYATIVGGKNNYINGGYSSILGGSYNSITGLNNAHIIGSGIVASKSDQLHINNLSFYGGVRAYADDAAAGAGGLVTGEVFQASGAGTYAAGVLLVKQ